MEISFKDQVALVTGAASGMGLATAKSFAESGAAVVLADLNSKAVEDAAQELRNKGYEAIAITCDVSKEEQVKAMVEKAVETLRCVEI